MHVDDTLMKNLIATVPVSHPACLSLFYSKTCNCSYEKTSCICSCSLSPKLEP